VRRANGAPAVLIADQESPAGSYDPPFPKSVPSSPPHTSMRDPVQTAACRRRAAGANESERDDHESVDGL
jgi:hypothetical protein